MITEGELQHRKKPVKVDTNITAPKFPPLDSFRAPPSIPSFAFSCSAVQELFSISGWESPLVLLTRVLEAPTLIQTVIRGNETLQ